MSATSFDTYCLQMKSQFKQVIIGIGLGLQVFVPAYIMTGGGPLNMTMFTALVASISLFSSFSFSSP